MRMDLAPDLIVLPGRDSATADEMATLLRLAGLDAQVTSYSFWTDHVGNPDLTAEVSALRRRAPAYVLAKSIGSLITILAQSDHELDLRAAFFIGVPAKRLRHEGRVDLLLKHCGRTPTVILQRRDDPTGSFAELADALEGSTGAALRELGGDTHTYADDEVAAALRDWWRAL